MISGKNLLLNIVPQTNPAPNSSTNSPDDVLALMLTGSEEKKDESTDPNAVDPNSFVLLLSQLFTNVPQNPAANEAAVTVQDAQNALVNQLTNSGATPQLTPADLQQIDPDGLLTVQEGDSNLPALDSENPALNWLESENFKTLKGQSNPLPTDSANKISTNKTQPEVNSNTLATAQTPPAVDASTTSTIVAQNSMASVHSSLENLDKVSAALVGGKSETSVDLINSPNNAVPVITNQPVHEQVIGQTKTLEIPVPVTHPQWGDKFADHIAWLGKNEITSAMIKIHPEELGPIEINIKVVKDVASVNIISHSAQVRDIMDQAIPKLRDMMSAQGLNLSEVQISADQRGNAFAQNNNNQQQQDEAAVFYDGDEEVQMVSSVKKPPKGLVDYFA